MNGLHWFGRFCSIFFLALQTACWTNPVWESLDKNSSEHGNSKLLPALLAQISGQSGTSGAVSGSSNSTGTTPPSNLVYSSSNLSWQKDATVSETPTFSGNITSCSVSPSLPSGLSLGQTDCSITGIPTNTVNQSNVSYTITASNSGGSTAASLAITIFRIIFVTASHYVPTSISDSKCNTDANTPPSPSGMTFAAVIGGLVVAGSTRQACSTGNGNCTTASGNNVIWTLAAYTEYRKIGGITEVMITNAAGITDLSVGLTNSLSSSPVNTWTGLNANWTTATSCLNWAINSSSYNGILGDPSQKGNAFLDYSSGTCPGSSYLICAQQ